MFDPEIRRDAPWDFRLLTPAVAAWVATAVSYSLSLTGHIIICITAIALTGVLSARSVMRPRRAKHRDLLGPSPAAMVVMVTMVVAACCTTGLAQRYTTMNDPLYYWAQRTTTPVTITGHLTRTPSPTSGGSLMAHIDATSVQLPDNPTDMSCAQQVVVFGSGWPHLTIGQTIALTIDIDSVDRRHGITATALTTPTVLAAPSSFNNTILSLQTSLTHLVAGLSPPAQNLIPAMVIGDKSSLDPTVSQAMTTASLSHVTVVSGLHVGIIMSGIWALTILAPRRVRAVITLMVVAAYAVIVGMGPSVIRASIMGGIVVIAQGMGRPSRAVSSLSVAVIVMILIDPQQTLSYSFTLSVVATFAIVVRSPVWVVRLNTILPRYIAQLVAVPLVAQIWCMPVLVMFQPFVALYGVVANMLVAPVISILMLCAVGAWLAFPLRIFIPLQWLVDVGLWIADLCCRWVITVATTIHRLPGAMIPWPTGWAGAASVITVSVLLVMLVAIYQPHIAFINWRRRPDHRRKNQKHGTVDL